MHEMKEKMEPDGERTGGWGSRSEGSARSTTEGEEGRTDGEGDIGLVDVSERNPEIGAEAIFGENVGDAPYPGKA